MALDLLEYTKELLEIPSVTPHGGMAFDVLQRELERMGFTIWRETFSEEGYEDTENLYARLGTASPNLCFAGHTDVVPAGDYTRWDSEPFKPEVRGDKLYGRGAEDMKGAIAAFVVAVEAFLTEHAEFDGSISLLITGDEEGVAVNGTKKMLEWLEAKGEKIEACLVGEPTNPTNVGEMIKIGRRGSLNAVLKVRGHQGHVAYPHLADNPNTTLVKILHEMKLEPRDQGTEFFPPTNLEVTSIDVGNETTNLIPETAQARINIRFNNLHDAEALEAWMRIICERHSDNYELECVCSGDAFLTKACRLSEKMVEAVREATGLEPVLSTTGGTSDARFIKDYCPVIEFGSTGFTPHKVNECIPLKALDLLEKTYQSFLAKYFDRA